MRHKYPAKRNIGIEIDSEVIQMWSDKKAIDFELMHDDAVNFLRSYESTGKELVYCDPPYLRETRKKYARIYKYKYTQEQHIKLLEVIKSLPCMVMISGYESKLYTVSLRGWHGHSYKAGCHHGVATEWVWLNYPLPVELHDYRHLGNGFRERERIRKKSNRWVAKLKSMPVLERQALLSAIHVIKEQNE